MPLFWHSPLCAPHNTPVAGKWEAVSESWEYTGCLKGLSNSILFSSLQVFQHCSDTQYSCQTTANKRSFLNTFVADVRQETLRINLVSILSSDFQHRVVKSREHSNLDLPYYTIVGLRQASERQLSKQYLLSSSLIYNAGNLKWTIELWGP